MSINSQYDVRTTTGRLVLMLVAISALLVGTACERESVEAQQAQAEENYTSREGSLQSYEAITLRAVLSPTQGQTASGQITFSADEVGVLMDIELSGLAPGLHGVHIHAIGDCSAADASSAGGHFNPGNQPHGGPASDERHVGDLGNVLANAQGLVRIEQIDTAIRLDGHNGIKGRAVVVHAGADDYSSQPSGNSGMAVACGVIKAYSGNIE